MMNLFDLHLKMTSHLFPAFSNTDERFLTLALCGEVGELANMIKKRWRDNVDLSEEIRDEIADIRIYLELIAKCFGIEGDKLDTRVSQTLVLEFNHDDERFIALSLCARAGQLATTVETRWGTGHDVLAYQAREQIVYLRIYLEMIAKIFLIEGKKLDHQVEEKMTKVIRKFGIKMEGTDGIKRPVDLGATNSDSWDNGAD